MRFTPHDYQRFAIDFIKEHTNAAVFLDMGLGKTVITLTALDDMLFDSFEVSRVLVVCPLRVVVFVHGVYPFLDLKTVRLPATLPAGGAFRPVPEAIVRRVIDSKGCTSCWKGR